MLSFCLLCSIIAAITNSLMNRKDIAQHHQTSNLIFWKDYYTQTVAKHNEGLRREGWKGRGGEKEREEQMTKKL